MKQIKIGTNESHAKITDILAEVNGSATEHTFGANDITPLAERAEKFLERLGVPRALRAGAEVIARSGEKMPRAYKYKRLATRVEIIRRAGGWYVADIQRRENLFHEYGPSRIRI